MAILNLRGMTSDSVFRCHYKAVMTHTSAIDTGKFNHYRLSNDMRLAGAATSRELSCPLWKPTTYYYSSWSYSCYSTDIYYEQYKWLLTIQVY